MKRNEFHTPCLFPWLRPSRLLNANEQFQSTWGYFKAMNMWAWMYYAIKEIKSQLLHCVICRLRRHGSASGAAGDYKSAWTVTLPIFQPKEIASQSSVITKVLEGNPSNLAKLCPGRDSASGSMTGMWKLDFFICSWFAVATHKNTHSYMRSAILVVEVVVCSCF